MKNLGPIMKMTVVILSMCLFLPATVMSMDIGNEVMAGAGTFRIAMQDDLKTLNPLTASDSWTWNVLEWLYDEPMYINPENGEVIPFIAVGSANISTTIGAGDLDWADCDTGVFEFTPKSTWGWEDPASDVGEVIIFYDFNNVTFHDDTQMDIRDVMFSFHADAQSGNPSMNCLKDNGGDAGSNYSTDGWLWISNVWESGDGKQAALKFILQEPYADFFTDTLAPLLLPYHIWGYTVSGQDIDDAKIWCDPGYIPGAGDAWDLSDAQSWDNNPPIGSGPFEFDNWQVGQSSTITTWPDHFYRPGYNYTDYCLDMEGVTYARLPEIDAMNFKIYKTAEQAILALRNNDIDYIAWPVPPTFIQELSNEPGVSIQFSQDPSFYYMAYNMRQESFGYDDAASFPYAPADDLGKPLREAIAHCIDKERIVDVLLQGFGVEGDGPVNPLSSWYNDSLPQYEFDPNEVITILENAGYQKTDGPVSTPGPGNWWLNPDGTPIGSAAGGRIEILTPPADYDPIRAQAGLMIAAQLQAVGIYAESVAMDFGSITNRIDVRDFDMYILDWDIKSQPPSYMYDFFHSSTVQYGLNHPGYMNESYDDVIDNASMTSNSTERLQHVKDAQASISYDLPIDVLYYRTNIEAYRSDRFVGWVVDDYGTIFNWQTILNLRVPSATRLTATFVSPPSAMESNSSGIITVLVRDQDTVPVETAHVKLDCTGGSFSPTEANTTAAGKVMVTFWAPYVPPSDIDGVKVFIEIEVATKDGYDQAPPEFTVITIYPASVPYLSASIVIDPDNINDVNGAIPGFTNAEVTVVDQNGDPVENALVTLSDSPNLMDISPSSALTDINGEATFTITSTDLPEDDDLIDEFDIDVLANLTGYANGSASANLWVVDKDNVVPTPVTKITGVAAVNILNTSARIVWETDQAGDGTVNYSTSSDLTSNTSVYSSTMTTIHAITLFGLTPDTTYYYEVSSSDDYGNWITEKSNENTTYMFTTLLVNPPVSSENWSTPVQIGAPVLYLADAYDNNLMAYSRSDVSTYSNDYGDSWSGTTEFSGRVEMYEDMVYRVNQSGTSILFSKSTDFGETWTPTINVFDILGSNDGGYGINYYESTLFVYSHDNSMIDYAIKLSISEDNGTTWSAPIIVDSNLMMGDPTISDIAYANGKLYMTYFNMNMPLDDFDDYQIIVIESSDMGETWVNRTVVATSGLWPQIAADGTTVHLTYLGIDSELVFSLKYTNLLSGEDWSTVQTIGPMDSITDPTAQHTLVADSGRIYAGYLDYHNNDLIDDEYILHITKSLDNGETWTDMGDVTGSTNNAMYPSLLISGERLHFIWSDFGSSSWGSWDDAVTMYRYILLGNETGDGGGDTGGTETNNTIPEILTCSPEGQDVPVDSSITITFDTSMNEASVEQAFSISPDVDGTFSWGANGTEMTFTPSSNLTKNSTYIVVINGNIAKSLDNNSLDISPDDFAWSFKTWLDYDDDGLPDSTDPDDDNDDVPDDEDDFPLDETETTDSDDDGVGNNADDDDDDDGFLDEWEEELGTDPLDDSESPLDTDGDGKPDGDATNSEDWMDRDDDGDGTSDPKDAFPLDETETLDLDGDGIGNNADTDDDGDGVPDDIDANPNDPEIGEVPGASGGIDMFMFVIVIIVIVGTLAAALLMRKTPEPVPAEPEVIPDDIVPESEPVADIPEVVPEPVVEAPETPPETPPEFNNE